MNADAVSKISRKTDRENVEALVEMSSSIDIADLLQRFSATTTPQASEAQPETSAHNLQEHASSTLEIGQFWRVSAKETLLIVNKWVTRQEKVVAACHSLSWQPHCKHHRAQYGTGCWNLRSLAVNTKIIQCEKLIDNGTQLELSLRVNTVEDRKDKPLAGACFGEDCLRAAWNVRADHRRSTTDIILQCRQIGCALTAEQDSMLRSLIPVRFVWFYDSCGHGFSSTSC